MSQETKDTGNPSAEEAQAAVFGSGSFFEDLDNQVNGVITEEAEPRMETRHNPVDPRQRSSAGQPGSETLTDEVERLKKRYGDSTREAQRMKAELDDLKPFVPVLDAMKNDSGLVEHVRGYLSGEQTPQTIKDQLGIDEDFVFDSDEAFNNPNSDSAKLMDHYVSKAVSNKMQASLNQQHKDAQHQAKEANRLKEESSFKAAHNMSDEDFGNMVDAAKGHTLTLEDIHLLLNRDKMNGKVADNARGEMLTQMKNVQNMPTSISGTNSVSAEKSPDDKVWEGLLDFDGDVDNLFGG
jgi:hypothetical protein